MKSLLLKAAGGGLLLLTAASLLLDIVVPDSPGGSPDAQAGFRVGVFIGMILRTLIFGGLGLGLLQAGTDAGDSSAKPWALREIEKIVSARRASIPPERPAEATRFEHLSDEELYDVHCRLDAHTFPERYLALLWVMSKRTSIDARVVASTFE